MVAIAPFRALRYNEDLIGGLSQVVAPPYDVISTEEQDRLHAASPYNIVRLTLGKTLDADDDRVNRYSRARELYHAWRARRVLIRDEQPACYLLEHRFTWEGRSMRRLGVVALLAFGEESQEQILSHESTFEGPKTDRARLLEAVRANLSPIFCLIPDPARRILSLLDQHTSHRPLTKVVLGTEGLRVWAITDPDAIGRIQTWAGVGNALIADGHHRFAVARSFRDRYGFVMSYLSCLEDPAVVAHPIHRVLRGSAAGRDDVRRHLETVCHLKPVASGTQLLAELGAATGQGQFGYYDQEGYLHLRLRDEVLAKSLRPTSVSVGRTPSGARHFLAGKDGTGSVDSAGLDVSLLHEVVLPHIAQARGADDGLLEYTPDAARAAALVDQGAGTCAWLLRGVPVAQVYAFATQGLMMPQKSTYFYPKVPSGLVMNPWED